MRRHVTRLLAVAALCLASLTGVSFATASPASAADCGTTFSGFGGTMTQTYKSCWGSALVTPAYRVNGGALHVFAGECLPVGHYGEVSWTHPTIIPNATYTTVFCEPFPIDGLDRYYAYPSDCWTDFVPDSPQGRPMDHYYHNCAAATEIAPAYFYPGGSWYVGTYDSVTVGHLETIRWHYSSTKTNVNYTTVFAVRYPNLEPILN